MEKGTGQTKEKGWTKHERKRKGKGKGQGRTEGKRKRESKGKKKGRERDKRRGNGTLNKNKAAYLVTELGIECKSRSLSTR